MDLKKLRGARKDDGSGGSNRPARTAGGAAGDNIDMSPEAGRAPAVRPGAPARGQGPRNIQETEAWQHSRAGLKNIWANYKATLAAAWKRMPRADQEAVVTRLCMIVTVGVTVVVIMFFYGFMPPLIRLVGVPALGLGSYWAGTRLVAPIILAQYEQYLNKEF